MKYIMILPWYPGGDSNSHVLRHTHLKRTCIPFQHLGICLCIPPDNYRDLHLGIFYACYSAKAMLFAILSGNNRNKHSS
jgi:hypothetical protein